MQNNKIASALYCWIKRDLVNYFFLSLKSKPFIRSLIATHFLLSIVWFMHFIPFWAIPVIAFSAHLCFAAARLGVVRVRHLTDHSCVVIKQFNKTRTLIAPVEYMRWWSYVFESDQIGGETSGTIGNDLNVFMAVLDSKGKEVVFTEYIGFDSRFPNECEHLAHGLRPGQDAFRVQRVDRLFSFLRKHLPVKKFDTQG